MGPTNDFSEDSNRVRGRAFRSSVPSSVLDQIQTGVMRTVYRGVPFYKSPFDIALYLQLLAKLRPKTVIEIGTKHGGSALWFADTLAAHEIAGARVISVDINPIARLNDPRITFLVGDAKELAAILGEALLHLLPRPWLVIDDSSHRYEDAMAVLAFFHRHLRLGDYIVIEDGIVSQFSSESYANYEDGPSRAVTDFLARHGAHYAIDETLCDFYGTNVTYNPNAWLQRIS